MPVLGQPGNALHFRLVQDQQHEHVVGDDSTDNVVDDAEEVRIALGYGKVNVMGTSYGTRNVQVYMRRHPESIRTAAMSGVLPLESRAFECAKMGNVHLKWAFSEAAALFLRWNAPGKKYFARIEKKHGKGRALSILAAKLEGFC